MNSAVTIACPKSCSPATPAERRLINSLECFSTASCADLFSVVVDVASARV